MGNKSGINSNTTLVKVKFLNEPVIRLIKWIFKYNSC